MKTKGSIKWWAAWLFAGLLAICLANPLQPVAAQEPQPGGLLAPQVVLGTGFTYQGQLIRSGIPYTGTCNFRFSLWNDPAAGSQLGGYSTVSGVTVTNGLFNAVVNSFGEFGSSATSGEAVYLKVEVQCTGDASYTALTPRQPLTGAPYALGLRPGTLVQSNTTDILKLVNVNTSGMNQALNAQTNSTQGIAVLAYANATTGSNYGVYGQNSSTEGTGVAGYASSTLGTGTGVSGLSDSSSGTGVYGNAAHTTGYTAGVWGVSHSPNGDGVLGSNHSTTGASFGVFGSTFSTEGIGVRGLANTTLGANYGVMGSSLSTIGVGVAGFVPTTTGVTYGVKGWSFSSQGYGVYGKGYANTGPAYGVYGETASTVGYGVYGYAIASIGNPVGVFGEVEAPDGTAIQGMAHATTGQTRGVWGQVYSPNGIGVLGESWDTVYGIGVSAISYGTAGKGVWGVAYAATGSNAGVQGETYSTGGYGVAGVATSTTGNNVGVFGTSRSNSGAGIYGYASSTTGFTYGAFGQSNSTNGRGVYGYVAATSGTTYGVYGNAASPDGYGGYFNNSAGVGIKVDGNGGTRTKATLLVNNSNTANGMAAYLTNYSSFANAHFSNGSSGQVLYLTNGGFGDEGTSGGDFIIGRNINESDTQFRIDTAGNFYTDGAYNTGGADFAELLAAAPGLEAGDVLAIGPEGKLVKASQPYQSSLAGVYSTQPAFLGGSPDSGLAAGHIPLAVVGVVPVKVSAENGVIRPGDLLTTSNTPGYAMKASPLTIQGVSFYPSGVILGKALGNLTSGQGVILVLLMMH